MAIELRFENPTFRTDDATVVDFLDQKCYRASIDLIIQDCKMLLLNFVSTHVVNVRRTGNGYARQLVGLAQAQGDHQWSSNEQLRSLSL